MKIEKVMVVGSGQMGCGIAQVLAQSGYQVLMNDIEEAFIQKGLTKMTKQMDRDIQKGRKTEEEKAAKDAALQQALIAATMVPLEIAKYCLKAIDLHEEYAKKGTRIAISDVGVGVAFCNR